MKQGFAIIILVIIVVFSLVQANAQEIESMCMNSPDCAGAEITGYDDSGCATWACPESGNTSTDDGSGDVSGVTVVPSPNASRDGSESDDSVDNGTDDESDELVIAPVNTNARMMITRRTGSVNKSIEISNPRGNISITMVTENGTKTIEIEKDFEDADSLKAITIRPGGAEVDVVVNKDGGTLKKNVSIDWNPRIKARVRQTIRNRECEEDCPKINVSYNETSKRPVITSSMVSEVNATVEVYDDGVYIYTPKMARKELKVLPETANETASQRVNWHRIKAIEIETSDYEVYYSVKGVQAGKLFWFFDVEMDVDARVDVESGEIKGVLRPWWAFLVF